MTPTEIVLILIGVGILVASMFVVDKSKGKSSTRFNDEEFNKAGNDSGKLTQENINEIKKKVELSLSDVSEEVLQTTEDKLGHLSNEKIIAVTDYSNQVLEKINQNHEEVIFLYNMLNEKESDIKNLIKQVESTKRVLKDTNLQQDSHTIQKGNTRSTNAMNGSRIHSVNSGNTVNGNASNGNGKNSNGNAGSGNAGKNSNGNVGSSNAGNTGNGNAGSGNAGNTGNGNAGSGNAGNTGNGNLGNDDVGIGNASNGNASNVNASTGTGTGNGNADNINYNPILAGGFNKIKANPEENQQIELDKLMEENPENNNKRILELYKQGNSIVEISKLLEIGQGEVKLVIDLFNKRR